jgi:hypothetical protein
MNLIRRRATVADARRTRGLPRHRQRRERDVDAQHRYGPDCSGMVSMAWHLNPGSYGGLNTSSLPSVSTAIDRSALKAGDILDYPAEHVVLFEAWEADHVHFSYYSFGSTPMKHYTHASFSDAKIAGWATSNYRAYRYKNIVDGGTGNVYDIPDNSTNGIGWGSTQLVDGISGFVDIAVGDLNNDSRSDLVGLA